ncbi:uncharacterized protein LOC129375239 [Poeciliopsis prolifica]|uniref:uncharacterized protein LOC129375239 n=1 Tax=Poeciliopsis prolifica TaxID=188132 RepID=UPI002413C861|nr:uncharacterized protein LOC129375239 [Poeciliopsis prolifica]
MCLNPEAMRGAFLHNPVTFTIGEGNDVSLPCGNLKDNLEKCKYTNWFFCNPRTNKTVMLFEHGQIYKAAKTKSDRLRIATNCSLLIRRVTDKDAGRYFCRQFVAGRQQKPDAEVILSVHDATIRSLLSFFIVQTGDDVTLPPGNGFHQKNCEGSTWIFAGPELKESVMLVESGRLMDIAETKLNRLFMAADCSLVIKNVSAQDVGSYTSRTYFLNQLQGPGFGIYVFVINLSEQKQDGRVTLFCSLLVFGHCIHSVRWMFEGEEEMTSQVEISTSSCSSNVTFTATDPEQKSEVYKSLKCEVMNSYTDEVLLFVFRPQFSGEKSDFPYLMRWIIVSVSLAVLIISVVRVEIWTKTKGNKTKIPGIVESDGDEDEEMVIYEEIGDFCSEPMNNLNIHSLENDYTLKKNRLILMITVTAAAGQQVSEFVVRVGDEVTLPCKDVTDVTEQKTNISFILSCSVTDHLNYRHTVEWLHEGEGETSSDSDLSLPWCRSTAVLTTSLHRNSTFFSSTKCKVTNILTKEVQLFTFSHQPTDHNADHNAGFPDVSYVLRCIAVSVGLAALLTSVIAVNMKMKNKTQRLMDDNEETVMEENRENLPAADRN